MNQTKPQPPVIEGDASAQPQENAAPDQAPDPFLAALQAMLANGIEKPAPAPLNREQRRAEARKKPGDGDRKN